MKEEPNGAKCHEEGIEMKLRGRFAAGFVAAENKNAPRPNFQCQQSIARRRFVTVKNEARIEDLRLIDEKTELKNCGNPNKTQKSSNLNQ